MLLAILLVKPKTGADGIQPLWLSGDFKGALTHFGSCHKQTVPESKGWGKGVMSRRKLCDRALDQAAMGPGGPGATVCRRLTRSPRLQPELNEGWGPKPQPSPHFSGRRLVIALLEICRRSKVARLYGSQLPVDMAAHWRKKFVS